MFLFPFFLSYLIIYSMKKQTRFLLLISYMLCLLFLIGCSSGPPPSPPSPETIQSGDEGFDAANGDILSIDEEPSPSSGSTPHRDNTPHCLVPEADGIAEVHNEFAAIDYSHSESGYIMARYTGTCPKVKMQITGADAVTYTYDLTSDDFEVFPLSAGDGGYQVSILENLAGTDYLVCLTANIQVALKDEFGSCLYPNQYCWFDASGKAVAKAAELAKEADSDLEVVENIYNFIISSITYDYDKAQSVPSGYIPNVDDTLQSGTGICLDYAAAMTAMLRSQRIPTRLEVGYVGEAYHAWISTYITDVGWVNGIVEFDGKSWKLMDPTYAASNGEKELKKFIGDGSGYLVKYIY